MSFNESRPGVLSVKGNKLLPSLSLNGFSLWAEHWEGLPEPTVDWYLMWICHVERVLRFKGIALVKATRHELLEYLGQSRLPQETQLAVRSALAICGSYLKWAGIRRQNPTEGF